MTYWQALGQVAGVGLNQEAASQRRRQLNSLNAGRRAGTNQLDQWAAADEADLVADLRGLTDQRYDSQLRLAEELSGPGRAAAGEAARTRANSDIAAALGMGETKMAGNRADLTGAGRGFSDWRQAADDRSQPLLDARQKLLTESRAQRGLARFDRGALDTAANTSIDLNRQAEERQQLSNLLAMQRQRMLAQLGIQYADPGPTQSQQNLGTFAGLLGAAGGVADSYAASNQGGYSSELGYDPDQVDRGTYVHGYTYNG